MSDPDNDGDYYDMLNDPEPGTCRQCGAAPINEAGICATCVDEHAAMVEGALDTIPGYPFLPCPICRGVEGCDHGVIERATAYELANGPHDHDHKYGAPAWHSQRHALGTATDCSASPIITATRGRRMFGVTVNLPKAISLGNRS